MNTAIELHDSDLSAITPDGTSLVLSFAPAYLHRSAGRPGYDAGSGWTQAATLTFSGASVSFVPELPSTVYDGWLSVGGVRHDNLVSVGAAFEAPCELGLVVGGSEPVVVRGVGLTIHLQGEPTYIEEFTPSVADA